MRILKMVALMYYMVEIYVGTDGTASNLVWVVGAFDMRC